MTTARRTLRIEFVSDVVCPWCAVGLGNLEQALDALRDELDVDFHLEPFELNPHLAEEGENLGEHIAAKYGSTEEQFAATRARLTALAADAGYTFRFTPDSRIWNTLDAHRLLWWAATQDEDAERRLKRALFRAHFGDGRNIAARAELAAIAGEAGLDAAAALALLESDALKQDVRSRENLWRRRGVEGVPAVVIDGHYLLSGGQPREVYERALRQIAATPPAGAPA